MADTVDPAKRSEVMRRVRSSDTRPEIVVRRIAHRLGYRFRLHRKDLPGTPDLVFPSRRKIIFVHGCFWHQHPDPNCKGARKPKSNQEYWLPKLQRNVERDRQARSALENAGWSVLEIWECETRRPTELKGKITSFLC